MAYPYRCQTDPPYGDPAHHNEACCHYQSNRPYNGQLCFHSHGLLFYKRLQMFLIQTCPNEPVMKLSGAFCKAEHRGHVKRYCRKDGKDYSHSSQPQAEKAQDDPKYTQTDFFSFFFSYTVSTNFFLVFLLRPDGSRTDPGCCQDRSPPEDLPEKRRHRPSGQ